MWLTSSSIGRKLIMSITGAALILFLTFHALMNGVAIFWPQAYNVVCEFLGANWYALVASVGLAALFLIHIIYAVWLTLQNRHARGDDRYKVVRKPVGVEWSSQNMLVLGLVVLAFLALHLVQFWSKMQLAEILHTYAEVEGEVAPPAAGTLFLQYNFQNIWVGVCYIIALVALWFHLTHGFWSMFHTAGWDNDIWIKRLKCIGNWWVSIVVGLFVVQVVVFTCMAKCDKKPYLNCPELQKQYEEMTDMMVSDAPEGKCIFSDQDCNGCEGFAKACKDCKDCEKDCKDCKDCEKDCKECKDCVKNCDKPCDKPCEKTEEK